MRSSFGAACRRPRAPASRRRRSCRTRSRRSSPAAARPGRPCGAGMRAITRLEDRRRCPAGLGAARDRVARRRCRSRPRSPPWRCSGSAVRQVHLVQHRHHLDAEVERGVAVGDRLRLDALARVDHQQRAFAGRQRAAHFVARSRRGPACRSGSGCRPGRRAPCTSSAAVCALIVMPRSRSMSIESSTCASISRSRQAAAALDEAIGQRRSCRGRCGR